MELLKSYGFSGFLHTTEFENFVKIFKLRKILPRNIATDFKDVADQDVINRTKEEIKNSLRFYYKEKTPTNFAAKYTNPVMLVFNRALIFDSKAKFASGNAGSQYTVITKNAEKALEFDWELIFERGFHSESKCEVEDEEMRKYVIKHRRNAEFLYEGELSTENIESIVFKQTADYDKAKELFGNDPRFCIKPELF